MAWRNPYGHTAGGAEDALPNHRRRIAEENQAKIMRRRIEARMLADISGATKRSVAGFGQDVAEAGALERFNDIKEQLQREDMTRADRSQEYLATHPAPTSRHAAAHAAGNYRDAEPDPFRLVRSIDLQARCAAVTHSGATIWAGQGDGSVRICDGVTGEVIHTVPGDADPNVADADVQRAANRPAGMPLPDQPPPQQGLVGAVTAMLATRTHVWVGFENGTVRVFDHTAFIHITEGRFHGGAVACFGEASSAPGVAARMVSAGDDGCLVVWDTEDRNFDAMAKIVLPEADLGAAAAATQNSQQQHDEIVSVVNAPIPRTGIACMAVIGGVHAICGTLAGNVVVVNIVSAEVECVVAAHTDAVLGLCTLTGAGGSHDQTPYIFTASADCSVAVWKRTWAPVAGANASSDLQNGGGTQYHVDPTGNSDGEQQHQQQLQSLQQSHNDGDAAVPTLELLMQNTTPSPVLCIEADTLNRRVWTGEQDGTVRVWFASVEDGFALERALPRLPSPVVRLHTAGAVDALKVWSLGSNGVNKMWYSSTHRSQAELHDTIEALKAIATQDSVELDKWRETVAKLQHVNTRRKLQLARVLLTQRQDDIRRRYLWCWRVVMMKAVAKRRREAIAARLAREHDDRVARLCYTRWLDWALAARRRTIKVAYSRLLMHSADRTSVHLYYNKMQHFVRLVKNNKKKRDLIGVLGVQSQRAALRGMFRKWLKFLRARQQQNRKVAYVTALVRSTDLSLTRLYYAKWRNAAERRRLLTQRSEMLVLLQQQSAITRLRYNYMQWRRLLLRRKTLARKAAVAQTIVGLSTRGLMLVFFRKWQEYLRLQVLRASEAKKEQAEADLATVRAKYADMEKIIEEKRRLDALEAELQEEELKLGEQDVHIRRLELTLEDLQKELDDSAEAARRKHQSLAERFATLIAQLKAQVINFHQDAALLQQIRDKAKNIPITKIFLEAHQQVKRVVVEITGKPHLMGATEPWPLTPQKLTLVPGHQWAVVLSAIKTMIISFDMMDRATRDGLSSDQEIVTNAQWLMQMADLSNEHRRKTLGRGAVRVK